MRCPWRHETVALSLVDLNENRAMYILPKNYHFAYVPCKYDTPDYLLSEYLYRIYGCHGENYQELVQVDACWRSDVVAVW